VSSPAAAAAETFACRGCGKGFGLAKSLHGHMARCSILHARRPTADTNSGAGSGGGAAAAVESSGRSKSGRAIRQTQHLTLDFGNSTC